MQLAGLTMLGGGVRLIVITTSGQEPAVVQVVQEARTRASP